MASRPPRHSRKAQDPNFVYESTPAEQVRVIPVNPSSTNRKNIRKKKKLTTKNSPEVLYVDCGSEGFHQWSVAREANYKIYDAQFHTDRHKEWLHECENDLKSHYKIPTITEEGGGHCLHVDDLCIFIYDNGTILIQGAKSVEWCQQRFKTIKEGIDRGKKPDKNIHGQCSTPVRVDSKSADSKKPEEQVPCEQVGQNLVVNIPPVEPIRVDRKTVDRNMPEEQVPCVQVGQNLVVNLPPVEPARVGSKTAEEQVPSIHVGKNLVVNLPPVEQVKGAQVSDSLVVNLPPVSKTNREPAMQDSHDQRWVVSKRGPMPVVKAFKDLRGFLQTLQVSFPNLSLSKKQCDSNSSKSNDNVSVDHSSETGGVSVVASETDREHALLDSICIGINDEHPQPVTTSTPEKKTDESVSVISDNEKQLREATVSFREQTSSLRATIKSLQKGKNEERVVQPNSKRH